MRTTLLSVTIALAACGCNDDKAAKAPAPSASVAATPSAAPKPTAAASATAPTPAVAPSATAAVSNETPVNEGAPFVVVPMKLVSADPKGKKGGVVDIKADGTVAAEGNVIMKFSGARIEDKSGKPGAYVDKEGHLHAFGKEKETDKAWFGPHDELMTSDGKGETKIVVADDGTITMTHKGKTETAPIKFEGFKPEARRVAAMVAMFLVPSEAAPPPAPVAPTAATAVSPH